MSNKIIPVHIDGIYTGIYAGFWPRFGSLIIDGMIIKLVFLLINTIQEDLYILSMLAEFSALFLFYVFLVKRYGGTPGKRIMNIRIIKINGEDVSWNEAFLREIVSFLILALSYLLSFYFLFLINKGELDVYDAISISEGKSDHPIATAIALMGAFTVIWTLSELLVLLLNSRKRALHDYIAGTVVVKDIYLDDIRSHMNKSEVTEPISENNDYHEQPL